jgi:hypothetical protein
MTILRWVLLIPGTFLAGGLAAGAVALALSFILGFDQAGQFISASDMNGHPVQGTLLLLMFYVGIWLSLFHSAVSIAPSHKLLVARVLVGLGLTIFLVQTVFVVRLLVSLDISLEWGVWYRAFIEGVGYLAGVLGGYLRAKDAVLTAARTECK